jgi:hypothetical protein
MTMTRDGLQRVPLMAGIGETRFVNDLTDDEVVRAARSLQQFSESLECPEALIDYSPFFDLDRFPTPVMLAS